MELLKNDFLGFYIFHRKFFSNPTAQQRNFFKHSMYLYSGLSEFVFKKASYNFKLSMKS